MDEGLVGVTFLLPLQFDLAATLLAAIAATWAACRRSYDVVGVCMLALVGSVGGGLLRDTVFLRQIPVVMQHSEYLWTILAGVTIGRKGASTEPPTFRQLTFRRVRRPIFPLDLANADPQARSTANT